MKKAENIPLSENEIGENINVNQKDFFAVAGIWKNRDINIDSLQKKAWREENK